MKMVVLLILIRNILQT